MVTTLTKTKSNKSFFDDAPTLLGFYYPSPQKHLEKNEAKIAIRAEQQDDNVLLTDSEEFAIATSDSIDSFHFNESWPSTEHDDKFVESLKKKENDHQYFGDDAVKKKSLYHQDNKSVSNFLNEEQDFVCEGMFSLDQPHKQISTSQISPTKESLQVQKRVNRVLKSAKTLLRTGNQIREKCSINEGFGEEDGSKQNSTLGSSCLLLNSDDVESYWKKERGSDEMKSSNNNVGISEDQVERNTDDISIGSSEFLVSSEGLGRWSGTNASSEEMVRPSFVNVQDNTDNNPLNQYTSDLPFSQYWKSNLNKDVLYQWRIKRRIQLAREQAKSEKHGFVPTNIFNQQQVTSQVGGLSEIGFSLPEKQLPQDVSLQVPWYSEVEDSTKVHTVPHMEISQNQKPRISTQPQIHRNRLIQQYPQRTASSRPSVIPECQSSLLKSSVLDIQSQTIINEQEPHPLLPQNYRETEADQYQFDQLRTIEKLPQCQKIYLSQKEKVNAEVQTSPPGHCLQSDSQTDSLINPCFEQSDSFNSHQHCACFHMNCNIPSCKPLSSHNPDNHTIIPVAVACGSDQCPSSKTTRYKYLVAEKPHCNTLDSNFSSQPKKINKNSKSQKKKMLKLEKFHEPRIMANGRMENKSHHTTETDNFLEDPSKSQHPNKVESSYHLTYQPRASSVSSIDFTDPQLFLDNQSSSDEEFSSDLMLQHLRKQRSMFKEQLRIVDEKLKHLHTAERN